MEQFTLLVIGTDIDEQLKKFDCNRFNELKEVTNSIDEFKRDYYTNHRSDYNNFETYIEKLYGYSINEEGKIGYYGNTRGKWNDYSLLNDDGNFKKKNGIYCSQALKGEIDFEGMLNDVKQQLINDWTTVNNFVKKTETFKGWYDIYKETDYHSSITTTQYYSQSEVIAFSEFNKGSEYKFIKHPVEMFMVPIDTFIEEHMFNVCTTNALIKNKNWHHKHYAWAEDARNWDEFYWGTIKALSDNTLLTILNCIK